MTKYEYEECIIKVDDILIGRASIKNTLNSYGNAGWKMVGMFETAQSIRFILVREKTARGE